MRITAEPRSDQWNAEDFIGGPRTFTVKGVKPGGAEQKYDIELVEGDGRVWRPPLTVLRILIAGWGDDATVWPGHRVTLYRDASITFGRDEVGGIRVSHMSHIDRPISLALTATRGRRAKHTVQPLPDAPAAPSEADVAASTDKTQLGSWWREHHHLRASIEARVEALKTDTAELPLDPS